MIDALQIGGSHLSLTAAILAKGRCFSDLHEHVALALEGEEYGGYDGEAGEPCYGGVAHEAQPEAAAFDPENTPVTLWLAIRSSSVRFFT